MKAARTDNLPRKIVRGLARQEMLDAEKEDPYAMGYDAAANLESPPDCEFTGLAARLWRNGFNARVNEAIADRRRYGGLAADVGGLEAALR